MHAKFIKENSPCFYTAKMLDGTWIADLSKIDTLAKEMIEKIIENLVKQKGITEELKAKDQFAWIFDLEQIKHNAEEFACNALIVKMRLKHTYALFGKMSKPIWENCYIFDEKPLTLKKCKRFK